MGLSAPFFIRSVADYYARDLYDQPTSSKVMYSVIVSTIVLFTMLVWSWNFWAAILAARLRRMILITQCEDAEMNKMEAGSSCLDQAVPAPSFAVPADLSQVMNQANLTGQPMYILVPVVAPNSAPVEAKI